MHPIVPALALLAILGVAGAGSAGRPPSQTPGTVVGQIRDAAGRLEWPALPDFLTVAGYTESRFTADAENASGRLGVFQLDPDSALVDELADYEPARLFDLRFAVVAAAYYTVRLGKYRGVKPLDKLTALDLRRGWAYPTLVDDYAETELRSRQVRARMVEAEQATGVSVASRIMFPPGWRWIGVPEALRRVA